MNAPTRTEPMGNTRLHSGDHSPVRRTSDTTLHTAAGGAATSVDADSGRGATSIAMGRPPRLGPSEPWGSRWLPRAGQLAFLPALRFGAPALATASWSRIVARKRPVWLS